MIYNTNVFFLKDTRVCIPKVCAHRKRRMVVRVITHALSVTLMAYSAVFFAQRVLMLVNEWKIEQATHERAIQEVAACLRTDAVGALVETCHQSRARTLQWPLMNALYTVLSRTHLCGDWTCTDAFVHVFASAPGMLITFLLGVLIGLVFLYNVSSQWDRRGETPYHMFSPFNVYSGMHPGLMNGAATVFRAWPPHPAQHVDGTPFREAHDRYSRNSLYNTTPRGEKRISITEEQ
jgi:hypothetical protein